MIITSAAAVLLLLVLECPPRPTVTGGRVHASAHPDGTLTWRVGDDEIEQTPRRARGLGEAPVRIEAMHDVVRIEWPWGTEELISSETGIEQRWLFEATQIDATQPLTLSYRFSALPIALTSGVAAGALDIGHATWVDAARVRWPIATRLEGHEVQLVVPREVLRQTRFPAMLDPMIRARGMIDAPVRGPTTRTVTPIGADDERVMFFSVRPSGHECSFITADGGFGRALLAPIDAGATQITQVSGVRGEFLITRLVPGATPLVAIERLDRVCSPLGEPFFIQLHFSQARAVLTSTPSGWVIAYPGPKQSDGGSPTYNAMRIERDGGFNAPVALWPADDFAIASAGEVAVASSARNSSSTYTVRGFDPLDGGRWALGTFNHGSACENVLVGLSDQVLHGWYVNGAGFFHLRRIWLDGGLVDSTDVVISSDVATIFNANATYRYWTYATNSSGLLGPTGGLGAATQIAAPPTNAYFVRMAWSARPVALYPNAKNAYVLQPYTTSLVPDGPPLPGTEGFNDQHWLRFVPSSDDAGWAMWSDNRDGGYTVHARYFSLDGTPLGASFVALTDHHENDNFNQTYVGMLGGRIAVVRVEAAALMRMHLITLLPGGNLSAPVEVPTTVVGPSFVLSSTFRFATNTGYAIERDFFGSQRHEVIRVHSDGSSEAPVLVGPLNAFGLFFEPRNDDLWVFPTGLVDGGRQVDVLPPAGAPRVLVLPVPAGIDAVVNTGPDICFFGRSATNQAQWQCFDDDGGTTRAGDFPLPPNVNQVIRADFDGERVQVQICSTDAGNFWGALASDGTVQLTVRLDGGCAPVTVSSFLDRPTLEASPIGPGHALRVEEALFDPGNNEPMVMRITAAFSQHLPDGTACVANEQCISGECVDGVCCAQACAGGTLDCQACSIAAGGLTNGTCTLLSASVTCGAPNSCGLPLPTCSGSSASCTPVNCPDASVDVDGGIDAGTADAGDTDAGDTDAGDADAGDADAGDADAGPNGGTDASVADAGSDEGTADAGPSDAGLADSGVVPTDGGAIDGGTPSARTFTVGCGCAQSAPFSQLAMLGLVAVWTRWRRKTQ